MSTVTIEALVKPAFGSFKALLGAHVRINTTAADIIRRYIIYIGRQ